MDWDTTEVELAGGCPPSPSAETSADPNELRAVWSPEAGTA
jgi:hypothetical protein